MQDKTDINDKIWAICESRIEVKAGPPSSASIMFKKWIKSYVKNGKFSNTSHSFEYCVRYTKNNKK